MPLRSLNLEVRWPDGRRVGVHISVLPLVGMRREFAETSAGVVRALDPDQLEPPAALLAYLAHLTAGEPDGGVLRAAMFEPDLATLLGGLGVIPPPPDPITIRLPMS